jgi:hypothetical protein
MRVKGTYRNQKVELECPLDLAEGAEVEVDVRPTDQAPTEEEAWRELGLSRLEEEWDNPEDAVYDNWRKLCGS